MVQKNNVTVIHIPGGNTSSKGSLKPHRGHEAPPRVLQKEAFKKTSPKWPDEGITPDFMLGGTVVIGDQNVGVSGGVCMTSTPLVGVGELPHFVSPFPYNETDDFGPYSLLSVHERAIETLTASYHLTTITIGERAVSRESTDSPDSGAPSPSTSSSSPPSSDNEYCEYPASGGSTISLASSLLVESAHKASQTDEDELDVTVSNCKASQVSLEWSDPPPPISATPTAAADSSSSDRGSSPTSFSSAYTVTEATNSDAASIRSRRSSSGSNTEEGTVEFKDASTWSPGSGPDYIRILEASYIRAFKNILAISESEVLDENNADCDVIEERTPKANVVGSRTKEESVNLTKAILRRLRESSAVGERPSGESLTYSYIPCRDQREKEDEEMWVLPPLMSPPTLPPDWGPRNKQQSSQSSTPDSVSRECLQRVDDSARAAWMATLMCPAAPNRRHFSARQRQEEELLLKKTSGDDLPGGGSVVGVGDPLTVTSGAQNKPTKRFSFLLRSHSLKDGHNTTHAFVSASDAAILERLAELNLETNCSLLPIKSNSPQAFPPSSCPPSLTPVNPRALTPPQPSCMCCRLPVYMQEQVRLGAGGIVHNSCFRCSTCGLRLTLNTFLTSHTSSPTPSLSPKLYCRTHAPTPTLTPSATTHRNITSERPTLEAPQHSTTKSIERTVVKCDTVGLRYF